MTIEQYTIAGMGHGTPLATAGEDGCGRSGAYMIEAGISSSQRICDFWGLAGPRRALERDVDIRRPDAQPERVVVPGLGAAAGVGKVIEDALRAAGLMR